MIPDRSDALPVLGHRLRQSLAGLLVLVIGGCTAPTAPLPTAPVLSASVSASAPEEVSALTRAIQTLGAGVDTAEADRAARVAIGYSGRLAQEYGVTDPPLIHNTKVNLGLRPRGLCYHWADDLEARLRQEAFETLTLHRAIANSNNLRIEHSTVILSRRGDPMERGIVLDPWRDGGDLYWSTVAGDQSYRWLPRAEVLAAKQTGGTAPAGPAPVSAARAPGQSTADMGQDGTRIEPAANRLRHTPGGVLGIRRRSHRR